MALNFLNPPSPGHLRVSAVTRLRKGEIIEGKYRILKLLGEGGMGVVVEAYHLHTEQRVAIKFLRPELAPNPAATIRFLREARTASAIQSEHVARVFDAGTLETGELYLVMELLQGVDLGALLRRRGPLRIQDAVDYVLQACEAMAEAHSLDVIHRDLKPSNLFLAARADGSPLVKVLDFGLAKPVVTAADPTVTATGEVVGSPYYMSPEQIRGLKDIDARSDVWAIGAILQKLITGRPPFDGDGAPCILAKIVADEPTRLRLARPNAPQALEALILRCLEKDRDKRIHDVAELAEALRAFAPAASILSIDRAVKVMTLRGKSQPTPVPPTPKTLDPALDPCRAGSSTGVTMSRPPSMRGSFLASHFAEAPRRGFVLALAASVGLFLSVVTSSLWTTATAPVATLIGGSREDLAAVIIQAAQEHVVAPEPALDIVTPGQKVEKLAPDQPARGAAPPSVNRPISAPSPASLQAPGRPLGRPSEPVFTSL